MRYLLLALFLLLMDALIAGLPALEHATSQQSTGRVAPAPMLASATPGPFREHLLSNHLRHLLGRERRG
ncbi:MAG: hypothetical protein R3200_17790 [Xanthomonadales bacterium]|nr:hypothetical protein [Xanthomonadales bacterium]